MSENMNFHCEFYSISYSIFFSFKNTEAHSKIYSDSGCNGSDSLPLGKMNLWKNRRLS